MAFQNGRSNKPATTTATGNATDTGTPKSLPPTKRVAFTDQVGAAAGKGGDGGYGENRYGGPSSVPPGQTVESRLATDLRTTSAAGGDDVLETIQKFGSAAMRNPLPGDDVEDVKGAPASQLRDISDKNVPDAFGMESARKRQPTYPGPSATVPGSLTNDNAAPVRKPGA
jgi:hypothetical protein